MDTFEIALKLINKNTVMTSADLRYVYYNVPIAKEHQTILRFSWNNKNISVYLLA
jgi:hypothetical protein